MLKVTNKNTIGVFLMLLLLTLNIFHTLFYWQVPVGLDQIFCFVLLGLGLKKLKDSGAYLEPSRASTMEVFLRK